MSLENKIISPMAPAELPGQQSEPLPKAGKKRRKSGGTASAALGKAKKGDPDDEVGGDSTAVLTLGASEELRRPQKKMLFESASEGATLAFAAPTIRRETPKSAPIAPAKVETVPPVAAATKPAPVAPAAKAPQPAPARPAPEPIAAPPIVKAAETAPTPPPAPQPRATDVAPIAAAKSSVFQVAALVMREPEPQPEPKDEAPPAQAEFALAVDLVAEEVAVTAAEVLAPAADATNEEEGFQESLTLAFDATLAEGLAERAAAAQEETASEPVAPAPTPSIAPELIALKTPELSPAAIEPAINVELQPTPAATEPPLPVYVAPITAAPKDEPKPESETPNRGLSRSEMIARTARHTARPAARPAPTAAETLAAARTAQQQLRSADLPKQPGDIYGYWARVKNGRRFPSRADFDAEQVAENWPNSMLLTCGNAIGAGNSGNFSSVLRLDANRRTRPGDDLNFTSMITDWILATGGEAARAGTPVQDTEVFPTPDGTHAYKIVALPLSENQTRVDHVLCHLSRS